MTSQVSNVAQLYRPEAVAHATRRLDGAVVLALPLSARLIGTLVVGILIGILIFIANATYARKEVVSGWLTTQSGEIRATAVRGGLITELLVEEGDIVLAGTPIARLSLSPELDGQDSGAAVLGSLRRQVEAANRAADAQVAVLDADRVRLAALLDNYADERGALLHQIELQADRARLAGQHVARMQEVAANGYASARDLEASRSGLLAEELVLASLQRSMAGLDRQMQDTQRQLDAIPLQITAATAQADLTNAAFGERTTNARVQNEYIVVSPIAARVAALPVRSNQTLTAGATVAVLVAENEVVVAELYIPSRAVGFVHSGQEVRLRYQAFPYQRFGIGLARITQVSGTVITPADISQPALSIDEPVFRARAILDRQTIDAYREEIALQPGMLLSADVITDRRSMLQWLFDPIFAAGRE
tara:strand:+ start:23266 stop:24528 length:1263 start_codon:yes stop_codon:yes gene_type:complete